MNAFKTTTRLLKPQNLENLRFFHKETIKKQTGMAAILDGGEVKTEWDMARPFHEIPGPKPLPIPFIGNIWKFLPFGPLYKMDLVEVHRKFYEEFGPIIRLSGFGKQDQLLIFEPANVEKMFRNESIWPVRVGVNSLEYYRTIVRKDFYGEHQGLVTSQGEQWFQFRKATNQTMMQPKNVMMYLDTVSSVIDEFIERIRYIRQPNEEMPDDFLSEINKMALESFMVIALDIRLGCLKKELSPDSEAFQMIDKVKKAMAYMHKLDFTPSPWKYISTPTWRKFVKVMDDILEFSTKHAYAKWEEIKKQGGIDDKSNKSILESLLSTTKDPKIPIIMATDVIFAGIDTTSNTLGTILYSLAMNPEKQEKLFQELKELLPEKNTPISEGIFNQLKYTRAVIKESMRMRSTTIGNQRVAVKDLVFNNYQIPKGTPILAIHSIMCLMDEHFKKVDEFLPERWLRSERNAEISCQHTNPFVFLPFGFGNRSCIGRRFAEMEMELALAKIIRNFQVSYHHEPMTWSTRLVSSPSKPLKYKMTERPN